MGCDKRGARRWLGEAGEQQRGGPGGWPLLPAGSPAARPGLPGFLTPLSPPSRTHSADRPLRLLPNLSAPLLWSLRTPPPSPPLQLLLRAPLHILGFLKPPAETTKALRVTLYFKQGKEEKKKKAPDPKPVLPPLQPQLPRKLLRLGEQGWRGPGTGADPSGCNKEIQPPPHALLHRVSWPGESLHSPNPGCGHAGQEDLHNYSHSRSAF